MKRKITDKTDGLTNVFPPRTIYTLSDKEMTTDQIIKEILRDKSTRTFDLSSIKETLLRFEGRLSHLNKLAFLSRHIAGGGHILIEVVYKNPNKSKLKEEFVINDVKYNDSKWPRGTYICHAYD